MDRHAMNKLIKILITFLILIIIVLSYYAFKNNKEIVYVPIEYEMPENVILQFDDTYVDCKQVSEYEIYCIVKDTKEV